MKQIIYISIFFLCLLWGTVGFALSCMPISKESIHYATSNSELVFIGRIIDIENNEQTTDYNVENEQVIYNIETIFKGDVPSNQNDKRYAVTGSHWQNTEIDETYLIFVKDITNPAFNDFLCINGEVRMIGKSLWTIERWINSAPDTPQIMSENNFPTLSSMLNIQVLSVSSGILLIAITVRLFLRR